MKKVIKFIQFIFFIICVFFLIKYILNSKGALINIVSAANITYLFISFILWSLLIFLVPWFSQAIIENFGKNISFSDTFSIYVKRLPAKYLPGGIWQTVARVHDLSKKGMTKTELSFLVFYENFWPVLISSIISGFGIYFYYKNSYWGITALTLIIIGLTVIPILIMLRKKTYIFSFQTYIKITIISICFWLLASISFLYYLSAFNIFEPEAIYIFNYMFSWLIGFLSIFTPQGVGVFELTMAQLTPFSVSLNESMVIIAGFRLIVFSSDIFNWFAYWLYKTLFISIK